MRIRIYKKDKNDKTSWKPFYKSYGYCSYFTIFRLISHIDKSRSMW